MRSCDWPDDTTGGSREWHSARSSQYRISPPRPTSRVSLSAWATLAFLVVASTLIGDAVFPTLNAEVSPTLANTFNYAAPVVALCLSALLLHEPLTLFKLLSGAVAILGVALMVDRRSLDERRRQTVAREQVNRTLSWALSPALTSTRRISEDDLPSTGVFDHESPTSTARF